MMNSKQIIINHEKGLHARVAAMVVHKASEIEKKYNVKLFIKYGERDKIPATSLMPLVLLKIKQREEVIVFVEGENINEALLSFCEFLESDFNNDDKYTINQVDKLLDNNAITWDQIVQGLENGIIVTDENDVITVFNKAAEKIVGLKEKDVVGKKINDVYPNSRLQIVNKTKKAEIGRKMLMGNTVVLTNRTPILIEGQSKGTIAVFQDISKIERVKVELKEVKELKERLQLILDSVQDGICVLNNDGFITYVNNSYLRILNQKYEDIVGKNIKNISPSGVRAQVLKKCRVITGAITEKENGVTIVANVSPIIVDGEMKGVVSVIKNLTEIKTLSEKLSRLEERTEYLEEELLRTKRPDEVFDKFIGKSGKVVDALATALKAATSNATVLIRGESGTGKELIAEGIHYASKRCSGPFIRVNCAAIPLNLIESELFGHEKGSFTGAVKKKLGKFELAQNGTIFLDEIGEMEKSMQAKILRVIQEKEIQRVGAEETIKVNVRIIAATHRNLEKMVAEGDFREDLYYRLNVIPIFLPSLRVRRGDIPALVEHFVNKICNSTGKSINVIDKNAMDALVKYDWPGNVRELENLIERVITLSDGEHIGVQDLPIYVRENKQNKFISDTDGDISMPDNKSLSANREEMSLSQYIRDSNEILPLKEYEKIAVEKALKSYGSYNAAGKALGVTHKTIASKAKSFGLEKITEWIEKES
jgi:phosphotransferase system HPr (HPr) family protein